MFPEIYFTTRQWQFEYRNVLAMLDAVRSAADNKEFNFDICTLDWDVYVRDVVLGAQKYFLNVDMDDLPRARQKLKW